MSGRYGPDQLYYASLILYLVLLVVNYFAQSMIISGLLWIVIILTVFRTFSRNIYKRRAENEVFLKLWNPVKAEFVLGFRRIKEIKTRRFRKCPNCRTVLRLPRSTGKHTVECPCCHKDFQVTIRF